MVLAWVTGIGFIVGSEVLPPVVGYLVILCACVLLGVVLGGHGGDPGGLRDHRQ